VPVDLLVFVCGKLAERERPDGRRGKLYLEGHCWKVEPPVHQLTIKGEQLPLTSSAAIWADAVVVSRTCPALPQFPIGDCWGRDLEEERERADEVTMML
jgi:hypothetical protein